MIARFFILLVYFQSLALPTMQPSEFLNKFLKKITHLLKDHLNQSDLKIEDFAGEYFLPR